MKLQLGFKTEDNAYKLRNAEAKIFCTRTIDNKNLGVMKLTEVPKVKHDELERIYFDFSKLNNKIYEGIIEKTNEYFSAWLDIDKIYDKDNNEVKYKDIKPNVDYYFTIKEKNFILDNMED